MTPDTPLKPRRGSEAGAAPRPEPYVPAFSGAGLFSPRGRHRKPRPRGFLLTAGGLALAAGALSLVRLTHDPGTGGPGTVEAEPHPGAGTATDRATQASAAVPHVSPSATSVLGGVSATPAAPVRSRVPAATGSVPRTPTGTTPDTTTIPEAPNDPVATTAPRPPSPPNGRPRPTPDPATPAPSPTPEGPDLCVPVVGLCVDPLDDRD